VNFSMTLFFDTVACGDDICLANEYCDSVTPGGPRCELIDEPEDDFDIVACGDGVCGANEYCDSVTPGGPRCELLDGPNDDFDTVTCGDDICLANEYCDSDSLCAPCDKEFEDEQMLPFVHDHNGGECTGIDICGEGAECHFVISQGYFCTCDETLVSFYDDCEPSS
jgi:hypothetical protein